MRIKVTKSEEFSVTPQIFKEEKEPPRFKFRTPNSSDLLKYLWTGDVNQILYSCFVGFENKIELVDENEKEIEYNDYKEFVEIGLGGDIALIHNDCVIEMSKKIEGLLNKAETVEKK